MSWYSSISLFSLKGRLFFSVVFCCFVDPFLGVVVGDSDGKGKGHHPNNPVCWIHLAFRCFMATPKTCLCGIRFRCPKALV